MPTKVKLTDTDIKLIKILLERHSDKFTRIGAEVETILFKDPDTEKEMCQSLIAALEQHLPTGDVDD